MYRKSRRPDKVAGFLGWSIGRKDSRSYYQRESRFVDLDFQG